MQASTGSHPIPQRMRFRNLCAGYKPAIRYLNHKLPLYIHWDVQDIGWGIAHTQLKTSCCEQCKADTPLPLQCIVLPTTRAQPTAPRSAEVVQLSTSPVEFFYTSTSDPSDSSRCAWTTNSASSLCKSKYFKNAGDDHSPAFKISQSGAPEHCRSSA